MKLSRIYRLGLLLAGTLALGANARAQADLLPSIPKGTIEFKGTDK